MTMHENRTEGLHSSLDTTQTQNGAMQPQEPQGTSDDLEKGKTQVAHKLKGKDTHNTDTLKMDTQEAPKELKTQSRTTLKETKLDSPQDIEKAKIHSSLKDEEMLTQVSYVEDPGTKLAAPVREQINENQSGRDILEVELEMASATTNPIRPKKLKTERDDLATRARNRSKSRLKTTHK